MKHNIIRNYLINKLNLKSLYRDNKRETFFFKKNEKMNLKKLGEEIEKNGFEQFVK